MLKNLAYILLLAVLLVGCRSHKQAVTPDVVDAAAFAKLSPKKQREAVEKSFIPWQWAYIPANVAISSPASISGGGRLTMQRDSLIHLSLRVLGMEVAVLYADTDSVYAVDKFHKYFLAESLDRIMASSGLSLGDIQDLLLSQALPPAGGSPMCTATLADGVVSALDFDLGRPDIMLRCVYPAHEPTAAGPVATSTEIYGMKDDKKIAAAVRLNLGSARWNTPRSVNFSQPKGYKRIHFDALLKSLKNL